MNNLIDIQSQIEKLQKQAEEIKAREFDKTVKEILSKMRAFGITLKDLQAAKPAGGSKSKKVAARSKPTKTRAARKKPALVAAKYQGPGGDTWSGRGLTPRWLSALIAQGKRKEEFLIKK